tara:strand:+ start:6241 stop:6729 length:489 start_codon:yes stop_codon:yes gene_type:complete
MNDKLIKKIENFILFIGREYRVVQIEDFKQDIILLLLEKGEEFIIQLEDENSLKKYIYKLCLFQIINKRGQYQRKYYIPSHFQDLKDIETYSNTCFKDEVLIELVDSLSGLDKILIEQLLICRGIKSCLSEKSKISNSTINFKIDELSKRIKQKWQLNEFYG